MGGGGVKKHSAKRSPSPSKYRDITRETRVVIHAIRRVNQTLSASDEAVAAVVNLAASNLVRQGSMHRAETNRPDRKLIRSN